MIECTLEAVFVSETCSPSNYYSKHCDYYQSLAVEDRNGIRNMFKMGSVVRAQLSSWK